MNLDTQARSDIDLHAVLLLLRRRWLTILMVGAVCIVGQWVVTERKTPIYRTESRLLVNTAGTTAGSTAAPVDPGRALSNEVALLEGDEIKNQVAKATGREISVSANLGGEGDGLVIFKEGPDPEAITADVRDFAEAYLEIRNVGDKAEAQAQEEVLTEELGRINLRIEEAQQPLKELDARLVETDDRDASILLQRERAELQQSLDQQLAPLSQTRINLQYQLTQLSAAAANLVDRVELVNQATEPKTPVRPNLRKDLIVATAAGILLGLGIALAREQLDDRVKSRLDLDADFPEIATLASIPEHRDPEQIVAISKPRSQPAEGYRKLRTALDFLSLEHQIRTVVVTSAVPGEGKTTVASNLAAVAAQSGRRVLIVGADFRVPTLHHGFGVSNETGLTSALLGEGELSELIRPGGTRGLFVLPAGPTPPNPAELLRWPRTKQILGALADSFDLVVIDTAPVLPVADPLELSDVADATLVVVRPGLSRRRQVRRAVDTLEQVHAPLAGFVMNADVNEEGYAFRYGYGRGKGGYYGPSADVHGEVDTPIPVRSSPTGSGS